MAVSCLEQRFVPLVNTVPFWKPWGPLRLSPGAYPDDEDEIDPQEAELLATRMIRSQSWGSYTTHAQSMTLDVAPQAPQDPRFQSPPQQICYSEQAPVALAPDGMKSQHWSNHRPAPFEAVKPVFDTIRSLAAQKSPANSKTSKKNKNRDFDSGTAGFAAPIGSSSPGGSLSPRGDQCGNDSAVESPPITTLMLRNLPQSLTQTQLLGAVDSSGFAGLYDFAYMPHKFQKHQNLGFAFLNFLSAADAAKFRRKWHLSRRFGTALNVSAAAIQGREENAKKALSQKMSRVKNPGFRARVFNTPPKDHKVEACNAGVTVTLQ